MNTKRKTIDNISGKSTYEVNKQLLMKTAKMYGDLETSFLKMRDSCMKPSLRELIEQFADEARNDKEEIYMLLKGNELKIETTENEYSMFDHLQKDILDDGEEKLISDAIRISEELRKVFSLISIEYGSTEIRNTFEKLVNHEKLRKNQLEELYDEIVTKGEW
ncbi:MAG: hypothetical protein ACP5E8_05285 [Thermoplasmata archaeon]